MDRSISPEGSLDLEEFSRLCRLRRQDRIRHSRGSGDAGTAAPREPAGPGGTGSNGIFAGMLRVCGNTGSSEEEEDEEEVEDEVEVAEEDHEDEDHEGDEDEEDADEEDVEAPFSVPAEQSAASAALRAQFPALWARSPLDCGRLDQEERLDGPPVPFQPQPRLPPHMEELMAELLREYLREGIVEEGSSGSNSPLILLEKPHGRGHRLSLDCGALNAVTAAGPPARPDRAAILASIPQRSRYFSVLDLCSACLAVPLARSSRPRFAFTFQGRQFWFSRLPPTFRGAASILHHRVAAALAPLEPGVAAGVRHYYDDILVTGKSWRQAESRTRRVLELLQSSGFKLNPGKAQLLQRRVLYLGVTLRPKGRGVPEEKLREMRRECDAPRPWDRRRLLSVLKKFEAREEFIPDFWELALPLQRLMEPGREWEWGREQREQLRRLRDELEAAPVLRFPARSRPFVVRLSVHAETAGARLLQEYSGVLVPVGHSSHRRRGRGLAPHDAWIRTAVRAVCAFRALTGPAPIVIPDPQGNFLLRAALPEGSQLPEPWTLLVALRGPEPPRSSGISIPPAPPLSWLPADIPRSNVWFLAVEQGICPCTSFGFGATSLEGQHMSGVCGRGSREDAELEALRELLVQHRSRFPLFLYTGCAGLAERLDRGGERDREQGRDPGDNAGPEVLQWLRAFPGMLLVREVGAGAEPQERDRLQEVAQGAAALGSATRSCWIRWNPARVEQQEIVAQCHQRRHEGAERTLRRAWAVESWNGARRDVARWVRRCPTCRESDPDNRDNPDRSDDDPDGDPGDDPDAPQREEGPWSRLRLSLSGPLPRSPEGFGALLLVQDALSGWLDAVPLRGRSRPELRRALLRDVFGRLGSVRSVLLSPGPARLLHALQEPPLRRCWSRLELSEPPAAAAAVCGAALAAGSGWAAALPLILAAARSRWVGTEELRPLLCVPGLPLELRREWPVREPPGGNELLRLRGARRLPGYQDQVEAALSGEIRTGPGPRPVRDWGTPDPGSRYARDEVRRRWVREWLLADLERDGIGVRREPEPPREAEGLWLDWGLVVRIGPSSGPGAG